MPEVTRLVGGMVSRPGPHSIVVADQEAVAGVELIFVHQVRMSVMSMSGVQVCCQPG